MPDPPVPDRMFAPSAETRNDREEAGATVEFLPPFVSRALIAGWILLFSGRWLVVQGLVAAGLFGPDQAERLDDALLGRCYNLLLSLTLVTLLVRLVRGLHFKRDSGDPNTDRGVPERPVSAVEGAVEAESSHRGGKQA